jgi:hypothetical protein
MEDLELAATEIAFKKLDIVSPGHILVVEINDYFPHSANGRGRSRVIPNILHLLDHADKHRAEGNFYITPGLLKDFPEVVSLVYSRGHEIGLCLDFNKANCPGNIAEFKSEIELATGRPSIGVLFKGTPKDGKHHIRKIAASGYQYCVTDFDFGRQAKSGLPVIATFDGHDSLHILPPSYFSFWGIRLNFGQAGNIRLYPLWFLRRSMREFAAQDRPAVVNFPLWEFDPHLPHQELNPIKSLKSYGNLSVAEFKLTRLMMEFDFIKIPRVLGIDGTK